MALAKATSARGQAAEAGAVRKKYPRGRPKTDAASAISTMIIDTATEAFLASGFADTSMEAVATGAGVTKATLYKRFPDKRALLRAVLVVQRPRFNAASLPAEGLEARLKYLARKMLVNGISPELRALHSLVISAWPDPRDMPSREEVLGYDDMLRRLEDEVRDGAGELGLARVDAAAVASTLMAMISGWFEHRVPDPDRDIADAEAFAEKAVEMLIHGKAAW